MVEEDEGEMMMEDASEEMMEIKVIDPVE